MSTATIADPSGTNPNQAYSNDLNITQDMLMDLENSNITKSKGIFKVSYKLNTTFQPEKSTTQTLSGGGTDTTSNYKNLLRFQLPFAAEYIGLFIAVSKWSNIDSSNFFTVQGQKSTYITDPTIPESEWSNSGTALTVNSTTGTNTFQSTNFAGQSFAAPVWNGGSSSLSSANFFRVNLTQNNSPSGVIQITAIFQSEHI
tara:strand:- start:341 stop:940 length:600 start_codon:yes stop_codon:yes gene_type:complete